MRQTLAMLLAGGMGSRLNVLAQVRAKPAVPFGGIYRIIDFTLSNVMHSGLPHVGILTQYKPYSLMKHIGTGIPWDFVGRTRNVKILPPPYGAQDSDWYIGTADAIARNLEYIQRHHPQRVLILSGDHIYNMDYVQLVQFHKEKKAELTIAMRRMPLEEIHHFGIGTINSEGRLIRWEEKPAKASSNLASMGIYVFNTDFLMESLLHRSGHDFGRDIIPKLIPSSRVYAYLFDGYWQDVGTLHALWRTHMDLLDEQSGLCLQAWKVCTNLEEEGMMGDRPPARIQKGARVVHSLLSPDCVVAGQVAHSVLSPGVHISPGAQVSDSIIMHDVHIGPHCLLEQVIVDKNVVIEGNCRIGYGSNQATNQQFPKHLSCGLVVIGKNAHVPSNHTIGRNCIIFPNTQPCHFKQPTVPSGTTLRPDQA